MFFLTSDSININIKILILFYFMLKTNGKSKGN